MTSWTIAKRITLVVAILCTLLLTSGAIVWRSLTTISREAASISRDAIPGTVASAEISLFNLRHFIVVRTYLRAPKEQREGLKQEMDRFSALVGARIKDYEATVTSQADRDLLKGVLQAREAFGAARQVYITAVESEQREEAVRMLDAELPPLLNKYNEATDKLFRFNADNGVAGGKAIVESAETTTKLVVLATGVAILLGIVVSFFIIRSTNGALTQIAAQLSTGSDETAAAAHEVSVSSHSLASGASEQAASLEETSASLEEISSMTKRNAENASKAKQIASATRDSAEKGATSMTEMNGAMGAINESATKIANIVKTIDEIAFQTNILALNAAVEAARAGEAGAGFAVVAEEVRRLAQRSATAAKETAALIEESVGRSTHGVQISGQVAQSFQHILEKAREVDALVAEIATASHEQHQGVGQVSIAVSEMDKVTQSTAANAEEAAAAAEELNSQSHLLRNMVGRLETLVGISHRAAALTERIAAQTAKAKPAVALPRAKSISRHAPAAAPAATPVAEESFAEVA